MKEKIEAIIRKTIISLGKKELLYKSGKPTVKKELENAFNALVQEILLAIEETIGKAMPEKKGSDFWDTTSDMLPGTCYEDGWDDGIDAYRKNLLAAIK
jgi:hypothetical protein